MKEREHWRDQLFSDHFESHWCVKCGGTGALYVIPPGEFLGACSRCLVERIGLLRQQGEELPEWVATLDQEAKRQLVHETEKQTNEFALDFDDFYRCCRCNKIVHQRDARYPEQAKDTFGGIGPHCEACYDIVAGDASPE